MAKSKIKLGNLTRPIMLIVVIIAMTIAKPGIFFTANNFLSILQAVCIYGIMGCGVIFVLLVGGMDLSIGSICALSGSIMIMTTLRGNFSVGSTILGIMLGLIVGVICGFVNGFITYYFSIPFFVISLASKQVILGIVQILTHQQTILCVDSKFVTWLGSGRILGVPFPIIFFLICVVFFWFILNRTKFGRYMYATGGNPVATRYSGINSKMMGVIAYTLSGLMSGMAGIFLSCMNRQCVATQGAGYDGDVLVALVVGGVSMTGGVGNIPGAVFGLVLIGILKNAMVLLGIDSVYQDLLQGLIAIIAVAIDIYVQNRNSGTKRRHFALRKKLA